MLDFNFARMVPLALLSPIWSSRSLVVGGRFDVVTTVVTREGDHPTYGSGTPPGHHTVPHLPPFLLVDFLFCS